MSECKSCGRDFVNHPGTQLTCEENMKMRKLLCTIIGIEDNLELQSVDVLIKRAKEEIDEAIQSTRQIP